METASGPHIHMNGRVYDPQIGRFESADPTVPDPLYSQAFNRYAYVYNNPLSVTDPSGFDNFYLNTQYAFDATTGRWACYQNGSYPCGEPLMGTHISNGEDNFSSPSPISVGNTPIPNPGLQSPLPPTAPPKVSTSTSPGNKNSSQPCTTAACKAGNGVGNASNGDNNGLLIGDCGVACGNSPFWMTGTPDWSSMGGAGKIIPPNYHEDLGPNGNNIGSGGTGKSKSLGSMGASPGFTVIYSKPLYYLSSPYNQLVYVFTPDSVYGPFHGSSVPNPFNPHDPSLTQPYAYPQIKGGIYNLSHYLHRGTGPALLLNNGGPVPTDNLDPNNGFNFWAKYIEVHAGFSANWPGSAGCLTINPAESTTFFQVIPFGNGILITPEIGFPDH